MKIELELDRDSAHELNGIITRAASTRPAISFALALALAEWNEQYQIAMKDSSNA